MIFHHWNKCLNDKQLPWKGVTLLVNLRCLIDRLDQSFADYISTDIAMLLFFDRQASDVELMWVMRASIVIFGVLGTTLGLSISSVYDLFVLCSDFVYVVLFPQLCCVVYFSKCNTYGSLLGYILGLFLRLGGGDKTLGIPPLIKYPYYDETHGQLFPYKTLSMIVSFFTIIIVSYLLDFLFSRGRIPIMFDVFKSFSDVPVVDDHQDEYDSAKCEKLQLGKLGSPVSEYTTTAVTHIEGN